MDPTCKAHWAIMLGKCVSSVLHAGEGPSVRAITPWNREQGPRSGAYCRDTRAFTTARARLNSLCFSTF
jgi:hypothetical protein